VKIKNIDAFRKLERFWKFGYFGNLRKFKIFKEIFESFWQFLIFLETLDFFESFRHSVSQFLILINKFKFTLEISRAIW